MRDVRFAPELFRNYMSGTVLDNLLCSYKGLPKGVNYMIIGDPGVGAGAMSAGAFQDHYL